MREKDLGGRIERMRIPDDDMQGWVRLFREGGYTVAEADRILNHLSPTYAKDSGASKREMEEILEEIRANVLEGTGIPITAEDESYFRKVLRERFGLEEE